METIQSKQRLVESNIVSGVSQKLLSEGTERYSNWGDHYRWTDEGYNHRDSCAVYFQHFFHPQAKLVQKIFKFCHTETRLPSDIFEKSLKVVSFDCGPGSDLVGFMSFYREEKKQFIKKCVKTLKKYMCTHRCVQHPKLSVVCRKRQLQKI